MNKICTFAMLLIPLTGCLDGNIPESTVMITNLASSSGGSGSIIEPTAVLTNAHVCGVVANGGLVHTSDGAAHFVTSYKLSSTHDLCVIRVSSSLGKHVAKVSESTPEPYEKATVSGHPTLLPNILTTGHFTGKRVIQVFIGNRPCTDTEKQDPSIGLFCNLMGGIPLIKNYESIVVSSLIQPGSSGSAVYGADNKVKAVIFAGAGNIGFGFAVPLEYVRDFLDHQLSGVEERFPDNAVSFDTLRNPSSSHQFQKNLEKFCESATTEVEKALCKQYEGLSFYQ